jgi:hypothetical protein
MISVWNSETRTHREVKVDDLTDEELVDAFAAEWESDSRRISSDPPDHQDELREELLVRLQVRNIAWA